MSLKDYFSYYKSKIIKGLTVVVILIVLIVFFVFYKKEVKISKRIEKKQNLELKKKEVKKPVKIKKIEEKEELYVIDIKGEVKTPGVYKLEKNLRVIDAVKKAGGFKRNSDTSFINLAKRLEDSMVIIIPSKEEVKRVKDKDKLYTKEEVDTICNKYIENNSCINNLDKVNINTGSLEELANIKGIGIEKAKLIIERREKEKFKTLDELIEIKGIGEKTLAKIKESLTV